MVENYTPFYVQIFVHRMGFKYRFGGKYIWQSRILLIKKVPLILSVQIFLHGLIRVLSQSLVIRIFKE